MALLLDPARAVAKADASPTRDDQASRLRDLVDTLRASRPQHTEPEARTARPTVPVIAFASGKGGVGKTCTAVNTAAALAKNGLRITLLDADLGTANADVLCGVNPRRRLDAWRSTTLDRLASPTDHGFSLIAGASGTSAMADLNAPDRARLASRLAELDNTCDAILIDAGAGIGPAVRSLIGVADIVVVVTGPEPTAIADAYALIKVTIKTPAGTPRPTRMGVLVNAAEHDAQASAVYDRIAAVGDRFLGFRPAYLGWVPKDERVIVSVRTRTPLVVTEPDAPASCGWTSLARGLCSLCGLAGHDPLRHDTLRGPRDRHARSVQQFSKATVK